MCVAWCIQFKLYHAKGELAGIDRGRWLRGKQKILEKGCDSPRAVSPILCKRLAGIFALWVRSKRVAA